MEVLVYLLLATLIFISVYASIVSFNEHENRATSIFLFISFLFATLLSTQILTPYLFGFKFNLIFIVGFLGGTLILFAPLRLKKTSWNIPNKKIDERNVMFSRNELSPNSLNFENYYKENPEHLSLDEKFRALPGLMSSNSIYYNREQYNAADTNFSIIGNLQNLVEKKSTNETQNIDEREITEFITKWAKKIGALSIGFTELKEYHKYSHVGRGKKYGEQVNLNHKFAIAFTVEMDYEMVKHAPAGPIVMESSEQYLRAATIAVQIAEWIRALGYEARAHIDANYRVVCPLVARDAGLGELGRMGLLMTPELGPRVRLGVVTTDLPLIINDTKQEPSVEHFCKYCKKCADTCPSKAISQEDMEEIDGVERWQINSEKCFTFWCKSGTDCGRCMSVCPYSHPNNLLHNFIRWAIKNNFIFARFAIVLDDIIYGKKPVPHNYL